MFNRTAKTALIIAVLAAPAAACGSHSSVPPRASMSALASVPGADATAILIRAGVPVHGTSAQQLTFAKSMMVKANRHALAAKLGVPAANRAAFESALLDAAKADHVLTSHDGRVKFLDQDMENTLARYAG